jgi:hypothetical protein
MCTAMLYDPKIILNPKKQRTDFKQYSKLYERFMKIKTVDFV